METRLVGRASGHTGSQGRRIDARGRLGPAAGDFGRPESELLCSLDGETGRRQAQLLRERAARSGCDTCDLDHLTRESRFGVGEDLPGRVWASQKPIWVDGRRPGSRGYRGRNRRSTADWSAASRFRSLTDQSSQGVIELFMSRRQPPHRELLEMTAAVGSEIGEFIHRTRVDERLRAEEVRKLAILESSLDAIVTMGSRGEDRRFQSGGGQDAGVLRSGRRGASDGGGFPAGAVQAAASGFVETLFGNGRRQSRGPTHGVDGVMRRRPGDPGGGGHQRGHDRPGTSVLYRIPARHH